RDYEDGPEAAELIADFNDKNLLQKLGSLKEHSSPDDKTLEEAMFNGILTAVKGASWQPGDLKTVVVIGDHPNHPVDPRGYTTDSLARELQKVAQSGFRFNAINVNVNDQYKRLNDEFLNQVRQIGNQLKPIGRFEQVRENSDMDRFRQAVKNVLRNV